VSDREQAQIKTWKPPQAEGAMVVQISGDLSDEQAIAELEATIRRLLSQGRRRIVLDLSDATFLNTRAIGAMAQAQKRAREREGELRIAGAAGDVWRVIEMVWLHRMIPCHRDVKEALRSF